MNHSFTVFLDRVVKRVPAVRRAKNSAAARQDPGDRLGGQRNGAFRPDQPVEPVVDADNAPAMSQDSGTNRSANDGIESRAISAPVGDGDSLNGWSHESSIVRQATGPEAQDDILHYPLKELEKYGRPVVVSLPGRTDPLVCPVPFNLCKSGQAGVPVLLKPGAGHIDPVPAARWRASPKNSSFLRLAAR